MVELDSGTHQPVGECKDGFHPVPVRVEGGEVTGMMLVRILWEGVYGLCCTQMLAPPRVRVGEQRPDELKPTLRP